MKGMIKYVGGILTMVVFLLPLNYYLLEEFLSTDFSKFFYGIYIYLIVLVSVVQIVMLRSLKTRPQRFVINFMAAMGIKIFLSLFLLMAVLYFTDLDKKVFGINFMCLYLLFSAFSIAQILSAQKKSEINE